MCVCVQVTIAVLVCGWAHVLHAVYKPWGKGTAMYALQHGSLFVTSFVFQMGLLFKVNAVSPSSPTFAALSAVLMVLCGLFLVCWMTVVLVYIPQNILAQHPKSAGVRRWLGWLPRLLPRLLLVPTTPTGSGATPVEAVVPSGYAAGDGIDTSDGVAGSGAARGHSSSFEALNPLCSVKVPTGDGSGSGSAQLLNRPGVENRSMPVGMVEDAKGDLADHPVTMQPSGKSGSTSRAASDDPFKFGLDRSARVPRMMSVRRVRTDDGVKVPVDRGVTHSSATIASLSSSALE